MSSSPLSKKYFALTRHPAFDPSHALNYQLGIWCVPYPNSTDQVLRTFDTYDKAAQAYELSDSIYEAKLPAVAAALNELHGTKHSLRYWRLVVGPWLYFFVSTVYDRYRRLKDVYAHDNDLATIGLASSGFYTTNDSLEFLDLLQGDAYNLQLLTKLVERLGRPLEYRTSDDIRIAAEQRRAAASRGFKVHLRSWYAKTVGRALSARSKIFLQDSYFPKSFELNLMKRSRGRIGRLSIPCDTVPFKPDPAMRAEFASQLVGSKDEFENILTSLIPEEIPTCFLEGNRWFQKWVATNLAKTPETIFSSSAWCFNERFKYWAAGAAEKGAFLIGSQHGGTYQTIDDFWWDRHEVHVTNRYFCWGKVDPKDPKRRSGPSVKWSFKAKEVPAKRDPSLLFLTTGEPRYTYQFPGVPEKIEDYLTWQKRFLQSFPTDVLALFRVRILVDYFGWDFRKRLIDAYPRLTIEDSLGIPFLESLKKSSLYICDHLATTYAESIVANHPTLLFWDPKWNRLKPEAAKVFEGLKSAGILYESTEAASEAVMKIYSDPHAWWNEKNRQDARLVFCEALANLPSEDPFEFWYREFTREEVAPGLAPLPIDSN